jgi:hypothetical protein
MDMGIIWDKYDSELKAQVLKDLMALKDGADLQRVQVLAPAGEDSSWVDAQLKVVGVKRVEGLLPTTWRAYIIEEEPVMPDCCEDWIVKDMRPQKSAGIRFSHGENTEHYPELIRQSDERVVPPGMSLNLNKMPPVRPNGNQGVVLPQNFWYSPFI